MIDRELTTLEYIVLGLISLQPQSGYDVVSYFESGAYSWSASPGSIYPMLKRLEKQRVILGELEIQYETRPRKVYHLQESGAKLLDAWLAPNTQDASLLQRTRDCFNEVPIYGSTFYTPSYS
jgi:PadR family transcriptional regulator PadR